MEGQKISQWSLQYEKKRINRRPHINFKIYKICKVIVIKTAWIDLKTDP